MALPALGVRAPPARLDAARRRALPARAPRSSRARGSLPRGFALVFVVVAVALYCDRDVAPVFGHSRRSRGRRTGEARARLVALRRARAPRRRRARTRRSSTTSPGFRAAARRLRRERHAPVRPVASRRCRTRSASTRPKRQRSPRRTRPRATAAVEGVAAAAAEGRATPSAGARSPTTATSARVSSPSACARGRPRRPRRSARRGRRARSTSCAGCTSSASRCSPAGSASACWSARRCRRARAALLSAHRRRRRSRARGRHRRLPAACRGRAPAAVRAPAVRRPVAVRHGTRFGEAFVAMTLGFALVAALLFLAWLTERRVPALAGVPALASASAPGSRSRATRPPTQARLAVRVRRLGAPLRGLSLDRRPAAARARRVAVLPDAATRGLPRASRGWRPAASACCSLAGVYLSFLRLPR